MSVEVGVLSSRLLQDPRLNGNINRAQFEQVARERAKCKKLLEHPGKGNGTGNTYIQFEVLEGACRGWSSGICKDLWVPIVAESKEGSARTLVAAAG